MSSTATTVKSSVWGGGMSPMNVRWGKLMMWYFLVSDAFTFSALLVAYGTTRTMNVWWPNPQHVYRSFAICKFNDFHPYHEFSNHGVGSV
jgi:cytochrome c oxidase subunit 3